MPKPPKPHDITACVEAVQDALQGVQSALQRIEDALVDVVCAVEDEQTPRPAITAVAPGFTALDAAVGQAARARQQLSAAYVTSITGGRAA